MGRAGFPRPRKPILSTINSFAYETPSLGNMRAILSPGRTLTFYGYGYCAARFGGENKEDAAGHLCRARGGTGTACDVGAGAAEAGGSVG